ncbi:PQQ-dependent sugar dehydrogenase [Nocardioides sp. GCM10027113]|uniref:PQQ-dependent sugar dehydrogenase n=1 Tax=unclassified Nocardioides TaxID=2615069 RepID=UPI003613D45E
MRALLGGLALALAAPLVPAAPALASPGTATTWSAPPQVAAAAERPTDRAAMPSLKVRRPMTGLTTPWDVQPLGGRRLLVTERDSARLLLWEKGETREVQFPSERIWTSGETGLMSLEVDPAFARNGRFYTCSGWEKKKGRHDVRVIAWRLNDAGTRARLVEPLVAGFPTTSGRHGGCRLLVLRNGALLVGTGDAASSATPRDLKSLGGKTLRLDPRTGKPWPTNPFIDARNRKKRFVHTFGHRNIQGLAQRRDGSLWNAEHGPSIEDEVNKLVNGGDYGWQPGPGYDENVPMTDHSLPGRQVDARWSSGPTPATSGMAWVKGKQWGRLNGTLAVACLQGSKVIFMKFDRAGKLRWTRAPKALQQDGRLRSITNARNGDLLLTTSNGGGDKVLRVSAR